VTKLDLRTARRAVEQQEGITRDNAPIKVDAVTVSPPNPVYHPVLVLRRQCRGAGIVDDASHCALTAFAR